ncbi:T9SS type A sorting domain-containing protein [Sunxiuqinia dokdonensis]|uniref:Secretion system C-terminal sorting domain-containing protein n=1 Tax=Sunxiuqinia dokdonensis TaxID=1409788 RepID=A0A0L8VFQ3_9BACT|nr:T9SS type A sorting domain-containing protein [Sunxiuqinia dokdonensis]KOH47173.1 hypothetical protein NC99_00060 [Sunxiuqinia dokdonensis]
MKQPVILLLIMLLSVFIPVVCYAQHIEFTYDNSGNRITRTVIGLKSAGIQPGSLDSEEDDDLLEDQISLQETRIYPNPTKGLLRIDFPNLANQEAAIRVFDSHGKLIVQQPAAGSTEVDLSIYPPGFYIMTIHVGQDRKEWKIIKE